MRILGIDPGLATVGYGVIEYNEPHFSVLWIRRGDNTCAHRDNQATLHDIR